MANVFISLPVPAGNGVGAWVDVSAQGPERTIVVDGGAFDGQLALEGSNDGQASALPAAVTPVNSSSAAPQTFVQAWNFLRVRRSASSGAGSPNVNVSAPASGSNVFAALAVPAGDGLGAATSIAGGGDINTFGVAGTFTGNLSIETSADGVNFTPSMLFLGGVGGVVQFVGVLSAARVRRNGTTGGAAPRVSVGSSATGAGGAPLVISGTLPIVVVGGNVSINPATQAAAGSISAADQGKLNGVPTVVSGRQTLLAPGQQFVIPNLHGDTEGDYMFYGCIFFATAVGSVRISCLPNGDGGAFAEAEMIQAQAGAPFGKSFVDLTVNEVHTDTPGTVMNFRARIKSKSGDGPRLWECSAYSSEVGGHSNVQVTGKWTETATEFTSMVFNASIANSMLAGSYVAWQSCGFNA